jgi:tetratricopeptide (TPR) repeat protein
MTLVEARRLDEAMAEFGDALRVDPGSADAHYGLGECQARRGRLDDAMDQYLECLCLNFLHMPAHFSLGNVYLTKGKINDAIRHFTTVITADPGHVRSMFNIGRCLEKNGQIADALQEYWSLTKKFPDFLDARLAAASCLVTMGRERDAAMEYRLAIARDPARMDIREALISLLEREGCFTEAIAEYRAIQALKPGDIEVRLRIANAMDRGGLISDAIDEYKGVIAMGTRNSFAQIKRNILLEERKKIDGLTDRYLGQVINRMETIGDHFRESMKLYLDGYFKAAADELECEIIDVKMPETYFCLGACIVRMGNLLAAVPHFQEAVRIRPDFPEAHTMLGILYERHGLLYESMEEYLKGVEEAQEQVRTDDQKNGMVDLREADPAFRFYKLV